MVNIPDDYYGKPVDANGLFETLPDRIRIIDHTCGTWFYGHDDFFEGSCWPWMRAREEVDRTHNDVHNMEITDGIWRLKS